MEEKYFMIAWEYVHNCNNVDNISNLDNSRDYESSFRSEIESIFKDKIRSDYKTRIKNACIIKTSSPIEEIRFEIAKLLLKNSQYGKFGEEGCYFEVHVLQMDFPFPVIPVKLNTISENS